MTVCVFIFRIWTVPPSANLCSFAAATVKQLSAGQVPVKGATAQPYLSKGMAGWPITIFVEKFIS